jgi:hypothetical protein
MDGTERLLAEHVLLLKQWRQQLADLESGRVRQLTAWRHADRAAAVLRRDIAMVEAIDDQLRS